MAIFTPTRIQTIRARLTPSEPMAVLITAQPITIKQVSIPVDSRIHFLKGLGHIRSKELTLVPVDNPSDSSLQREMKAIQYAASPRIGLQLTIRDDASLEEYWLSQPIPFYNNGALHEVNISQVLADLTEYGLQSGFSILGRLADLGFGEAENDDEIHITGYASRWGEILQDSDETIYSVS